MAAKVITIAQQKGGAGKTTLAVQLAVAWQEQGLAVALLDVDPQGSVSAWFALRKQHDIGGRMIAVETSGWKLPSEIDRLRNAYDVLIIDTPPHAETDARVAVRAATLVLVPLQPSPMDLWATRPTLELARKEKAAATLVLNRVPSRGKLADMVRAKIAEQGFPLAEAIFGNRSAYAASMMEGQGVVESQPRGVAAAEVRAVAVEIGRMIGLPTAA